MIDRGFVVVAYYLGHLKGTKMSTIAPTTMTLWNDVVKHVIDQTI